MEGSVRRVSSETQVLKQKKMKHNVSESNNWKQSFYTHNFEQKVNKQIKECLVGCTLGSLFQVDNSCGETAKVEEILRNSVINRRTTSLEEYSVVRDVMNKPFSRSGQLDGQRDLTKFYIQSWCSGWNWMEPVLSPMPNALAWDSGPFSITSEL